MHAFVMRVTRQRLGVERTAHAAYFKSYQILESLSRKHLFKKRLGTALCTGGVLAWKLPWSRVAL